MTWFDGPTTLGAAGVRHRASRAAAAGAAGVPGTGEEAPANETLALFPPPPLPPVAEAPPTP